MAWNEVNIVALFKAITAVAAKFAGMAIIAVHTRVQHPIVPANWSFVHNCRVQHRHLNVLIRHSFLFNKELTCRLLRLGTVVGRVKVFIFLEILLKNLRLFYQDLSQSLALGSI